MPDLNQSNRTATQYPLEVLASYRPSYLLLNAACMLTIIAVFSLVSRSAALVLVIAWFAYLTMTLRNQLSAIVPLLFMAACYERPVVDLGFGITATVKLFDIVSVAAMAAYIARSQKMRALARRLVVDGLIKVFAIIVVIAVVSAALNVYVNQGVADRGVSLSMYYAIKIVQYLLIFTIAYSIPQTTTTARYAITAFLCGLSVAGAVAILQGVGVLENAYYTAVDGSYSEIESAWAIGTLGPNHSHLGVYAALGLAVCFTHIQHRYSIWYFVPITILLGGLYFSHSAVGMGMVVIFMAMLFLEGGTQKKLLMILPMIVVAISMVAYFQGYLGGSDNHSTQRTAQKFSVSDDSEIITRSLIRPISMLADAASESPGGILWGYGFRSPDLNAPLPRTGDNNYFSVMSDLGLIGFMLFCALLVCAYQSIRRAGQRELDSYGRILNETVRIFFICVVVAMLVQEILWPLHSRGNTFAIVMIFCMLTAVTFPDRMPWGMKRRVGKRAGGADKPEPSRSGSPAP